MKRTVSVLCALTLLLVLTSAYAGSPGSATDPLITKTYIDNAFIPGEVSDAKAEAASALNAVYSSAVSRVSSGLKGVGTQKTLAAFYDGSVTLSAGSCFTLLSGSGSLRVVSGTVIDTATGKAVSGGALSLRHRYLCCEDSMAVFSMTASSTCAADGLYSHDSTVYVSSFTPKAIPAVKTIHPTTQKIIFNGRQVEMEVYSINAENYFKLRDIAYLLQGTGAPCSVDFDSTLRAVWAVKGGTYVPVGSELATGTDKSSQCSPSKWAFIVDGEYCGCVAYSIGGNNFFRLRDLGSALGFGVDWDKQNNAAVITA